MPLKVSGGPGPAGPSSCRGPLRFDLGNCAATNGRLTCTTSSCLFNSRSSASMAACTPSAANVPKAATVAYVRTATPWPQEKAAPAPRNVWTTSRLENPYSVRTARHNAEHKFLITPFPQRPPAPAPGPRPRPPAPPPGEVVPTLTGPESTFLPLSTCSRMAVDVLVADGRVNLRQIRECVCANLAGPRSLPRTSRAEPGLERGGRPSPLAPRRPSRPSVEGVLGPAKTTQLQISRRHAEPTLVHRVSENLKIRSPPPAPREPARQSLRATKQPRPPRRPWAPSWGPRAPSAPAVAEGFGRATGSLRAALNM